jgi:WD40-like Beta Propeller Repeat
VNHALHWSGDGKWLYFISHAPTTSGVWKVAMNGGHPVRVSPRQSHWAAESPDGRDLYLTGDNKMWKVPVSGGAETEVIMSNMSYGTMARDGFYFKPPGTDAEIHFFSFETGKSKLAIRPLRPGLGMAVSPDGRWLLYSQVEHSGSDLMLVENFR